MLRAEVAAILALKRVVKAKVKNYILASFIIEEYKKTRDQNYYYILKNLLAYPRDRFSSGELEKLAYEYMQLVQKGDECELHEVYIRQLLKDSKLFRVARKEGNLSPQNTLKEKEAEADRKESEKRRQAFFAMDRSAWEASSGSFKMTHEKFELLFLKSAQEAKKAAEKAAKKAAEREAKKVAENFLNQMASANPEKPPPLRPIDLQLSTKQVSSKSFSPKASDSKLDDNKSTPLPESPKAKVPLNVPSLTTLPGKWHYNGVKISKGFCPVAVPGKNGFKS